MSSSLVLSPIVLLSVKRLAFSPVSSWSLLIALVLLLAVFFVLLYARKGSRINPRLRGILVGLRIAALVCVVLALFQPVLNVESPQEHRPKVLVLIDGSASMRLPFDLSVPSDSARSRETVAESVARDLLKQLPRKFESSLFVFSDSLRPLEKKTLESVSTPESASVTEKAKGAAGSVAARQSIGTRTALGEALEQASSRAKEAPAAIVVISDGASTFGPDPTSVAKAMAFPVYTVLSAKEGGHRDIEITEILHPLSDYAGTEMPILVRVRGYGLENLNVPIAISEGENVVSRGMLKLAGPAETEVLLSLKPGSPGLHFYKVSVPIAKGEASSVNNSSLFAVRVLSEKLRVLCLEGELTWDFEFLKRQLESDPRLDVTFAFLSAGKTKVPVLANLVASASANVGRSSVIFLCDGAARYIDANTWRSLESFVSSGGGLFVLGAEGLGGISESGRRALPAQILRPEAWGPQQYLNCRITFAGLNHPICDIGIDEASNASIWKDVSPLLGSHVIEAAKPGVTVLFEAGPEGKSFPVIAAGSYGRGKAVLVAASGIWRWGFSLPGVGGPEMLFSGFVSNSIAWLTETAKDNVADTRPQSWVFQNGDDVVFSGSGSVEVSDGTGRSVEPLYSKRTGADSLTVDFGALRPGTYKYRVSAGPGGGRTVPGPAAAGSFVVDSNGPEYRNLYPDPRLLTYVSEASGGKSFGSDQVSALAREIKTYGEKTIVERQVRLWNHPLLFSLFAAFVAIEWWLRRRSGLP